MNKILIPKGYASCLSLNETQRAIGLLKRTLENRLCQNLNLTRVSAPLFVEPQTGLNDNLSGVERPVSFDVKATRTHGEVVHSLAKWKRLALHRYGFNEGEGICTDMNAIRRDEDLDNIHSIYVDQWDWEKILPSGQRNVEYLQETVRNIVESICHTGRVLTENFPSLKLNLQPEVSFITSQELEDMYPSLSPKEREDTYVREYKTVFIMGIGGPLKSGASHDMRAPDYDDWALNGDILFYNEILDSALELSSMGIRVDAYSLDYQLKASGCDNRRELPFHKMLLNNELPLTIGGGIGQSRTSMLLLNKAHIGEVQASIWDENTKEVCEKHGVVLL